MSFIVELSKLAVLPGEGTNVDVVSIAPPKPGVGGPWYSLSFYSVLSMCPGGTG